MLLRIYRREIGLIFLTAALSSLPFHFPDCHALAFVCLVPLSACLAQCSSRREATIVGYLAGILTAAVTYSWLIYVTVSGYIAMTAYLGLFMAVFSFLAFESIQVLARAGQPRFAGGWIKVLTLSALWVLVEFLRSHMPVMKFPWALLAASQWKNIVFIQSADFWGSFGLSWVVSLINFCLFGLAALVWGWRKRRLVAAPAILAVVMLAGMAGGVYWANEVYGRRALNEMAVQTADAPVMKVSLIQGNIPQEKKWNEKIRHMILNKFVGLTRQVILDEPDLVVWPETSFPGFWDIEPEMTNLVRGLPRELDAQLLVGTPTFMEGDDALLRMNSALLLSERGEEIKRHHKLRLVPFGEYVPFMGFVRRFFDDIGHFSPGNRMTLFDFPSKSAAKGAYAVLICFEDVFADLCRDFVRHGAGLLINITNDAWFMNSTGPYQHAQNSVLRAVENRVWVIRCANTGLSCFIDPGGNIVESVKEQGQEIMVTGFKTFGVRAADQWSYYTRHGDYILLILLGIWIITHRLYSGRLEQTSSQEDLD
ncbi:MAG: apolipoprotein N-acyltransferase [Candidatus Omnitrophica bacterium]|nr:apolipoprotein N-acyltransferase [Candidatus Omnitrophota bacterium]